MASWLARSTPERVPRVLSSIRGFSSSKERRGSDTIWMNNVRDVIMMNNVRDVVREVTSLLQCTYDVDTSDCRHSEDASVECV